MDDILQKIVKRKRERLSSELKRSFSLNPRKGLFLKQMKKDGVSLICEYKNASPSKGIIREDLKPEDAALFYQEGGARAISVLTEEDFFKGDLDYIRRIRNCADIPVLRKDFIIEKDQIHHTVTTGADCVLLIAAVLGDAMGDFTETAFSDGLEVLAEVHNQREMELVLDTPARIIGVNNRNLKTFSVDLNTTKELALLMDDTRILIAESGVYTRADVEFLSEAGADGVLIGESLMKTRNKTVKLAELLGKTV